MRHTRAALLQIAVLLILACEALAAPRVGHVIVVSIDGGSPAIIQRSKMATVFSLAKRGASTWRASTVFPSITLVSHTSMLTGVLPEKHGISWNSWEPTRGLPKVPTVFSLAKRKGLTTALFAGKEKFAHLMDSGSLDQLVLTSGNARELAEDAARYIVREKPNLCFVHFTETDSTGHRYGWGSPEQLHAFADEDAAIGILCKAIGRARITEDAVLIVTADHGGHAKTHGSDSPEDMTIPWIAFGKGVRRDCALSEPLMTCDTAATVLWLLDVPLPSSLDGRPVVSAFTDPDEGTVRRKP